MKMKKRFPFIARLALVLVYLVIVAGALVRMTGSGMGCPDWPKCFGHYIPPTSAEQLMWKPDTEFQKGYVIIHDETLLIAKNTFTSDKGFNSNNWEPYTKHDYAIFNVFHTWTEYLNRLIGAIAGFGTLAMAVASISYWRERKRITLLSWTVVFLMGFQGWLGATVVYSVLNPLKITIHMVMALVIVAVILYIIRKATPHDDKRVYHPGFKALLGVSLALTLLQVIIGTQVREHVDTQTRAGITDPTVWLENPAWDFYFHRTFSLVVLAVNGALIFWNYRRRLGYEKLNWVMGFLGIEIASGIAMYYFSFPFGSQALHLVIASLLFGLQYYLFMECKKPRAGLSS